jgi:hypothetical protein
MFFLSVRGFCKKPREQKLINQLQAKPNKNNDDQSVHRFYIVVVVL